MSKIEVKSFKIYLVLDYRTGNTTTKKKKPKKIKPYEIVSELNIKVNIPVNQSIKFDVNLDLSEQKVSDISSELI